MNSVALVTVANGNRTMASFRPTMSHPPPLIGATSVHAVKAIETRNEISNVYIALRRSRRRRREENERTGGCKMANKLRPVPSFVTSISGRQSPRWEASRRSVSIINGRGASERLKSDARGWENHVPASFARFSSSVRWRIPNRKLRER